MLGNVIHAVCQFGMNILVARVLLPADYGLINYSASIATFFVAISTLGFHGTITKKFAENEDNAGKYLWSAAITKLVLSLPLVLACVLIGYLQNPGDGKLHSVMLCQAMTIPFASLDLFIYWFRYKYKASLVAILRFVAFLLALLWRIVALFWFKSTALYVLGTVGETMLLGLMLLIIYKVMNYPKLSFERSCLKELLSVSYPFIFSAILTTIYGHTDMIMLEWFLSSEAVGYYSVSLTLAGAISIIPNAIIEGFRPEIMRLKETDEAGYQKRMRQVYFCVFWVCMAYCTFITIFAHWIVLWLYGAQYLPSVPVLSLIVWYTSFSYFGAINSIFMVAEQRTKWVLITTLLGALVNVLLNCALVPTLGIMGAALASLITQIIINNVMLLIIRPLRKCFFLQVKGILNIDCFPIREFLKKGR